MKKTILSIVMATLCLISTTKAQQAITLTGRVITSPDSKPLPGATVKIEQGRAVVLSDSQGAFTIKTTLPDGVLIISYTGSKQQKSLSAKPVPALLPLPSIRMKAISRK